MTIPEFIPGSRVRHPVDQETVSNLVYKLLWSIGYNPDKDADIKETPRRVAKFWAEFLDYNAGNFTTTFEDEGSYNQMVIVAKIQFTSMCSHHLLPFIGEGTVGYIPGGRVIGLSKIPRIFQQSAHKLQMQERIGREVAEMLPKVLQDDCLGVMVVIKAVHTCMCARGPRAYSPTTTRYMTGQFKDDPAVRNEFYALANLTND